MDAKNLEVLRQLKSTMEMAEATTTPAPQRKAHVPGQGFSEESEEFFRELARKRFAQPPEMTQQAKPPAKADDLVKRRQERAARKASKKARAEEARLANRRALEAERLRKLNPRVHCPECKVELPKVEGQLSLPRLCTRCRKRSEEIVREGPGARPRQHQESAFRRSAKHLRPAHDQGSVPLIQSTSPGKLSEKKICSECKSEYPSSPDMRVKRGWLCHNCRAAKKEKHQEKLEAKRVAQYQATPGTKIEQLERKIAAVNAEIERTLPEKQRGLLNQLRQLERQLRLERVHKLSRFNNIRFHIVSGSYGSGKRSK